MHFLKLNKLREKRKYSLHAAGNLNPAPALGQKKPPKIVYKADTALYSLDGKDYSYGDLQKEVKALQKDKDAKIEDVPQQLRIMHGILIPLAILGKEEDFQKAMQTKLYDFVMSFIEQGALALAYYQQQKEKLQVDQAEILKNYKANKEIRYKGRTRKKALELIRNELKQSIFAQWQNKKQAELTKKYKLTIKNELLKADKV